MLEKDIWKKYISKVRYYRNNIFHKQLISILLQYWVSEVEILWPLNDINILKNNHTLLISNYKFVVFDLTKEKKDYLFQLCCLVGEHVELNLDRIKRRDP